MTIQGCHETQKAQKDTRQPGAKHRSEVPHPGKLVWALCKGKRSPEAESEAKTAPLLSSNKEGAPFALDDKPVGLHSLDPGKLL